MAISNPTNTTSAYTDFSALNDISIQGREDSAQGLKEVAKQFESLFLNMMLKSMRESNKMFSEGNYLSSNEMDFYQQNFDDQLSLDLSSGQGIGLADTLYRQMLHQFQVTESNSATLPEPSAAASEDTAAAARPETATVSKDLIDRFYSLANKVTLESSDKNSLVE